MAFCDKIIFRTLFGQTDRQTDRETDRPTDRQTDRQTERQTLWIIGKLQHKLNILKDIKNILCSTSYCKSRITIG